MDQIDPRTHYIHEPFDGENLEGAKWAADRPFPFTPWESLGVVTALLAAIGCVGWQIIKMGAPV